MRAAAALATLLSIASPAAAGILVEAKLEGVPVRLELAHPGEPGETTVLATVAGAGFRIDLVRAAVLRTDGRSPPTPARPAAPAEPRPGRFRVTPLGGGAMVAGHGGTWQIVVEDERVCGEVLAASWMLRFLEPAIRALELLQQVEPSLAPRARHGCSPIGFRTWTSGGWPLLAGGRDEPVFSTETLRFDHRPAAPTEAVADAPR